MAVNKDTRKPSAKSGKVLMVLFSSIVSLCVTIVFGEAYIRLTKPYMTPDALGDESLEYEATVLSRNAFPQRVQRGAQRHVSGIAMINSRGYRGEEFAIPKPAGTTRIVLLGGSAVFDIYAKVGEDWPNLVETKLHEIGHSNIEIINAATPGHATWDSLGRLYGEIWMFEPDYVVVCHAWNDIKYFTWLSSEKSLLRGFRPLPVVPGDPNVIVWNPFTQYTGSVDHFFSRNSQLYVRLRWRYMSWRLGLMHQSIEGGRQVDISVPTNATEISDSYSNWGIEQYKLNLRVIADTARDIGAEPIFLTQPRLVSENNGQTERDLIGYEGVFLTHEALLQAFEQTDEAIFDVAQIEHVTVFELSSLNGKTDLFRDHVHTTRTGSEAVANAVANLFAETLDDVGY